MATVQNAERDKGIVPQPELFSIPQGEQVKEESSERVDPNKVEFIEEYGNPQQGGNALFFPVIRTNNLRLTFDCVEHKTPRKSTAYNKEEFKPSPTIKRIQEKMPKPHQKTSAWHTLSNAERDDLIAVEVRYRETTDKFNQYVICCLFVYF